MTNLAAGRRDAKPEDEAAVRRAGAEIEVARGDGYAERVREMVPDGVDGLLDAALLGRAATYPPEGLAEAHR